MEAGITIGPKMLSDKKGYAMDGDRANALIQCLNTKLSVRKAVWQDFFTASERMGDVLK